MSTNPYAAPKAQVADETIVLRGSFIADGRRVPTGNGWTWITDAWSIFRAEAGIWIGMVLLFAVIFIVAGMIPVAGPIASMVFGPVFTAGLVIAARTIDQGGDMQFSQLFAGFRHRFGTLVSVGALYFVGFLAILVIVSVFTGAGLLGLMMGTTQPTPEEMVRIGAALAIGVLLMLALLLPLVMAIWFAPPLVVFHELGAVEAMKRSFVGCLKNMLPFLLYGVVLLVAGVIASIPLLLGWLVLGPVIGASVYTSYRDIYFADDAAG